MRITAQAPPPRPFDFSRLDTPEEAMLAPGADLWAGLVLGPLPGRVSLKVGDQTLRYENIQGGIRGKMDGQPFQLKTAPTQDAGMTIQGDTPGGPVDTLLRGGGGGFGYDGKVGDVEVSEMLALGGSHLAYLSGTFNGTEYEAFASKLDGSTVGVEGHLGDQPVHQTIHLGPKQEWIIEGQLGSVTMKETIWRKP